MPALCGWCQDPYAPDPAFHRHSGSVGEHRFKPQAAAQGPVF
jgi:hypothetical protein